MGHVHIIATQHLDVAWLWTRVPQGEDIMRQCFERAIAMIEAYPDKNFVFSRSTAWSFWIVQQRYPDLFEKVRHYVRIGRIELCGGEWVEPDHLIPSGESLVRQSILGQWYFQETFDRMAQVCWDPDIFGHAHTLPQIIRKSGMEGYYFHRCRPKDVAGHPLHQFIWEGPDGSRIYILSGQWVGKPDEDVIRRAAGEMEQTGLPAAHVVTGLRSDRRITMQVDWVPLPDEMDQDPDLPTCSWSKAEQVLEHMQAYQEKLPVIRGELAYQYTGTYTSNSYNKRSNRELETLLLSAEKAATWAHHYGFPYQEEQLVQAWRDLCVNQFHDIICGTSYAEVHNEDKHLFEEAKRRAQWLQDQALAYMGDRIHAAFTHSPAEGTPFAVFDFATWPRTTQVVLPAPDQGIYDVIDEDGNRHLTQPVNHEDGSTGVLIQHSGKGLAYGTYHLLPGADRQGNPGESDIAFINRDSQGTRLCMENTLLNVEIDPETGEIVKLLDKRSGEDMIPPGGAGNRLQLLRDGGLLSHGATHCWEPWNIMYTGESLDTGKVSRVRMMDTGPLRGRFRIERRIQLEPDMPQTVIVQEISLHRDSPLVTFKTYGTWNARQIMLKMAFDLPFDAQIVAVDAPYGTAERPPYTESFVNAIDSDTQAEDRQMSNKAVPEPDRYMQKWLDVSNGRKGLLFLNNGLYGYDAEPRTLRLSLLRAPYMRPELDEVIGLGPFSFTYAVLPHKEGWREIDAPRWGYSFNTNPVVVPVRPGRNEGVGCGWWDVLEAAPIGVPNTFLSVTGGGVIATVLKRAHNDSGIILRIFESLGQDTETQITMCDTVLSAVECDLLERIAGDVPCSLDAYNPPQCEGAQINVALNPFEIKTLLVHLKSNGRL